MKFRVNSSKLWCNITKLLYWPCNSFSSALICTCPGTGRCSSIVFSSYSASCFTACSKVSQPFLLRSPASIPALLDRAWPCNNPPQSALVLLTNSLVKCSLVRSFTVVNKNSVTKYQLKESCYRRSLPNSKPNPPLARHPPLLNHRPLQRPAWRACPL